MTNDELIIRMQSQIRATMQDLEAYNADEGSEDLKDRGMMLLLELHDLIDSAI